MDTPKRLKYFVNVQSKHRTLNIERKPRELGVRSSALDVRYYSYQLKAMPDEPNHEIERKFLIRKLPEQLGDFPHQRIEQGYLVATRDGRQVRLRRRGESCTLTFKTADGAVREEREIELGPEQFDMLWPATAGKRLTKTRHEVPWDKFLVEIDVYHGINDGIIVAEVEFENEQECAGFSPPEWFGEEVTASPRYSNVALARE